jgi:hypothetical protein
MENGFDLRSIYTCVQMLKTRPTTCHFLPLFLARGGHQARKHLAVCRIGTRGSERVCASSGGAEKKWQGRAAKWHRLAPLLSTMPGGRARGESGRRAGIRAEDGGRRKRIRSTRMSTSTSTSRTQVDEVRWSWSLGTGDRLRGASRDNGLGGNRFDACDRVGGDRRSQSGAATLRVPGDPRPTRAAGPACSLSPCWERMRGEFTKRTVMSGGRGTQPHENGAGLIYDRRTSVPRFEAGFQFGASFIAAVPVWTSIRKRLSLACEALAPMVPSAPRSVPSAR